LINESSPLNPIIGFEFLMKVIMVSFVLILFGKSCQSLGQPEYLQFAILHIRVTEVIHLLFRRLGTLLAGQSEKLENFLEASVL
jgi:hypothetical protein